MLTSDAAPVAFRSDSPELIERGSDSVLRLRPARAGSALTPTSATVTVTDPNGTVVVNAGVATCASGAASYTVLGSVTTGLALGERWQVVWSVFLPGESVARQVGPLETHLVRHRLYPVISDQDLFRRVSALDPSSPSCITSVTDYSPYLDDAWALVQEKLVAKGDRPWLVMSPQALREVHLQKTLQLVFEDLSTRLNPAYADQAKDYRQQFTDAWTDLRFLYDRTDGGTVAGAAAGRKSPGGSVWLGGRMP